MADYLGDAKPLRIRGLKWVLAACALLAASGTVPRANASTLAIFDTGGTTVNLTMFLDDATGSLLGGDARGLAGVIVTDPASPNGIVFSDYGLTTLPSTLIFGLGGPTFAEGASFFLDIFNWSAGGPGILVPVTAFPQTAISDPAMLTLLSGPITFGFAFSGTVDDGTVTSVNFTLAAVTVGAPEPGTWLLAMCGVAAGVLLKARRAQSPR